MKIILATPIYPPAVGGPATHAQKYAEGFSACGNDVRIVSYGRGSDEAKNRGVIFVSLCIPSGIRHIIYFALLFRASRGVSVIYALDAVGAGLPALLVARMRGVPLVVRVGGDLLWERRAESGKTDKPLNAFYADDAYRNTPLYRVARVVLAGAHTVIVVCPMLKDLYREHYLIPAERIEVVHNPAPRGIPINGVAERADGKKIILFASRFVLYKNLKRLVAAFADVHRHIPDTELVLAGEGPERSIIERTVRISGLSGSVRFPGVLGRDELDALMERASVCVAPALTEFHPNYIMECLSRGTPVAVSRNNGLPLALSGDALFDPLSTLDMARAIRAVLEGRAGFPARSASLETWESVLEKNMAILRRAIEKNT